MPATRDPVKALRLNRRMERRRRQQAITSLQELCDEVARNLEGLQKGEGLHDATDLAGLAATYRRASVDAVKHASSYAAVAELERAQDAAWEQEDRHPSASPLQS